MKSSVFSSLRVIALIILVPLIFSGCELFENADDITFEEEFELVFEVDENQDGENVSYSDFRILELSSNSILEPYLGRIEKVEINRITYQITDYQADDRVFFNDGIAAFGSADANAAEFSVPFAAQATGVDLQSATAETDLTIDQEGLNKIAAQLLEKKAVKMYAVGILSKTPVQFRVVSKFYVTITANALESGN